ncbi:hypothetical protein [Actinomyces sp. zg296]|uniref:hypothetical protein n=1 Tax=Actinomyces sp. zg296 TaxID=2609289 RepID=UPI001916B045|nr:hypothetical protein [Actinomyces sp. zg296]
MTLPKGEAARALADAVEMTNARDYAADPGAGAVPLARAVAQGGARGSLRLLGAASAVAVV